MEDTLKTKAVVARARALRAIREREVPRRQEAETMLQNLPRWIEDAARKGSRTFPVFMHSDDFRLEGTAVVPARGSLTDFLTQRLRGLGFVCEARVRLREEVMLFPWYEYWVEVSF